MARFLQYDFKMGVNHQTWGNLCQSTLNALALSCPALRHSGENPEPRAPRASGAFAPRLRGAHDARGPENAGPGRVWGENGLDREMRGSSFGPSWGRHHWKYSFLIAFLILDMQKKGQE